MNRSYWVLSYNVQLTSFLAHAAVAIASLPFVLADLKRQLR